MNPHRYKILFNAQTEVAKKVLMAVSTERACSSREVYRALIEAGTPISNLHTVEGCLNSLCRQKLLKEPHSGRFVRVLPSNYSMSPSAQESAEVEDEAAPEEAVASIPAEPVVEIAVEPYKLVPDVEKIEQDHELELYFNLRYERVVGMLKLLSEKVDDDAGLAILEIAEELDDNHSEQAEYYHLLDGMSINRMVCNEGWYQHELDECIRFSRKEVLDDEEIARLRQTRTDGTDRFCIDISEHHNYDQERRMAEQLANMGVHMSGEEAVIFKKFEPDGFSNEFYRSIMDRVKDVMPDIEPVAEVFAGDSIVEMRKERKNRRGMCDIKIHGISQAPEYRAWMNILSTANMQAMEAGGMEVHEEWQESFSAFLADVGYRPCFGAKLRRKDLTVGWVPDNVLWMLSGAVVPPLKNPPHGWPLLAAEDRAIRRVRRLSREADRASNVRRHTKVEVTIHHS